MTKLNFGELNKKELNGETIFYIPIEIEDMAPISL